MRQLLSLLLPAYGVSVTGVAVAFSLDQLGRGAELWRAVLFLPVYGLFAALFALPFILMGAVSALFLNWPGRGWWRGRIGKAAYTLICAGLGAGFMAPTTGSLEWIAAAAGGTAAWLSLSPDWPPLWRRALVLAAGLGSGIIMGIQYN